MDSQLAVSKADHDPAAKPPNNLRGTRSTAPADIATPKKELPQVTTDRSTDARPTGTATRTARWWPSAAIYQVYVRSFADGNGDGTGDITGVRAKLEYLADLGIEAIWFNP